MNQTIKVQIVIDVPHDALNGDMCFVNKFSSTAPEKHQGDKRYLVEVRVPKPTKQIDATLPAQIVELQ